MTDGAFVCPGKADFEAIPSESVDYAVMDHCLGTAFPIHMVPLDARLERSGRMGRCVASAANRCTRQLPCGRSVAHRQPQRPIPRQQPLSSAGVQQIAQPRREKHRHPTHRTKTRKANTAPQSAQPRGWYDSFDEGGRFKVKRIQVKPKASLSPQKHHHRAEPWIVVSGTARSPMATKCSP